MLIAAIEKPGKAVETMSLGGRVAVRFCAMSVIAAGVVFLPAGTWRFWQGWALLSVFIMGPMGAFLYLLRHDRELVERRLRDREQVSEQKLLMRLTKPLFVVAFLLPGFDYRFGWSRNLVGLVPVWLSILAVAMVAGGFLFVIWVLRVNSFAGRTIQVDTGQKVISTGPYAMVRHPMYSAMIAIFVFTPLALGSWVTLPAFALTIPFCVVRLLNEEKVLRAELPGYTEYCGRMRYRLVPLVW
jgi:protein-S-isoprenylcysteine O-methyltransferase Ste14